MVNGSLCNIFALPFLQASFRRLWLQPYFMGFCRVGVSQSQPFGHFLAD